MAYEYYTALGIAPEATQEQIKEAYAHKRREVAQRRDEEALKLLLEAKTTLMEPKARANYDSYQQHGEEVKRLQAEVIDAQETEDWEEVIRLLKRMCVLMPREPVPFNQLAIAHLRNGDPAEGVKVLERLSTTAPDVALYWSNLGTALIELGDLGGTVRDNGLYLACSHCGHDHYRDSTKKYLALQCERCGETSRLYTDDSHAIYLLACERLQKAVALEPKNPGPYLEIARAYCKHDNYSEAIEWAQRGISADGRTDINDLEDFFSLCFIYLFANRPQDLYASVSRMLELSDDEEFPQYLSWRFAKYASEAFKASAFVNAAMWWKCVAIADPTDLEAQEVYSYVKDVSAVAKEYEKLRNSSIISPFKRRAAVKLFAVSKDDDDDFDIDAIADEIIDDLCGNSTSDILQAINHIKSSYPATYRFDKDFYVAVGNILQRNDGVATKGSTLSSSTASGCIIPMLTILAMLSVFIVVNIISL